MATTTNFNQSPYFDDYEAENGFHKVLFKPSVAVQARELTQLQTILQSQIESFGDNVLREGTIIRGGNFKETERYDYIKILDANTVGQPVALNNYKGLYLQGQSTGVIAMIEIVYPGLESQKPDLNTLYLKYLNSRDSNKTFIPGEILDLYTTYEDRVLVNRYTEANQGDVYIPASLTVAPSVIDEQSVGLGYGATVSNGIIFQKGNFILFEEQSVIVSKYDVFPDDVVVGFKTEEEIVTALGDTSLLDNANGFNNFNAPGADRLKLIPILTRYTLDEAKEDENFFAIQEYNNGALIRRNNTTQFNSIAKQFEQRTSEESGNYSIDQFDIGVQNHKTESDLLEATAGKGIAYVEGKRVDIVNTLAVAMREGTDTRGVESQDVLANYGSYVIVDDYFGIFEFDPPTKVDLYDTEQNATSTSSFAAAGNKIGEAHVRAVVREPGEDDQYRLYLFNIIMNDGENFRDVMSFINGVEGVADAIQVNGQTKLVDPNFKSMIVPIGKSSIKEITEEIDYQYRVKVLATINTSGEVVIDVTTIASVSASLSWPYSPTLNSDQIADLMVVCIDPTNRPPGVEMGQVMKVDEAYVSGDELNIKLFDVSPGETEAVVYCTVTRQDVNPSGKELITAYIKIDGSTYPDFEKGDISLGLPDVQSIEGIWSDQNEYAEFTSDLTNRFKLYRNDTEEFYGISYIKKSGPVSIRESDKLLVKVKVFKPITSGGTYGQSFFCVNSYPIDDTNTANTIAITTQEIPTFELPSGEIINLRDAIDFRPVANPIANYSTDIENAVPYTNSINTDRVDVDFGTKRLNLIAPNETVEISYDYYLGRRDRFFIDSSGAFSIIEGEAAEIPFTPNAPTKGMTLAVYEIPPYPSLTYREAAQFNKLDHAVKFNKEITRGYTMSDIAGIEQRIDRLEYYLALNSLEMSAKDLIITGEDGLDRFKNGLLVDNFEDLSIANVQDVEYNAGISRQDKALIPAFRKYALDLVVEETANVTDYGAGATLPKTDVRFVTQRAATSFKNCTTGFYSYIGNIRAWPEYDGEPEVSRAPDINFNIDLAKPFMDFTNKLGNIVDLTDVPAGGSRSGANTTHTWTESTTKSLKVSAGKTTTKKVGDFITDVNFSPFMRGRNVNIHVTGLRPTTRFYFFFDEVNVTRHVAQAVRRGSDDNPRNYQRSSGYNKPISSDANGILRATYRIPEETFKVGDRELLLIDVDDLSSADAATSSATFTYSGFNFSYEKSGLEMTTRMPQVSTKSKKKRTSSRIPIPPPPPRPNPPAPPAPRPSVPWWITSNSSGGGNDFSDPIAQTFSIDEGMSEDNALQITAVDVYFKDKSRVNGVNVMIRQTSNGYPAPEILPFATVNLKPSEVSISDDATVATRVNFEVPVTLTVGTEYCLVVQPDADDPDYLIWVAKTGLADVKTGVKVTQDANPGTLFTSTNNKAWTPYNDENMTFQLYKAQYSEDNGLLGLSNANNEFFTCDSYSGEFQRGEKVFIRPTANANGAITVKPGNTIITGVDTAFDSHTVGDWIVYLDEDTQYQPARILEVANSSYMVVNRPSPVEVTTTTNYFVSPVGDLDYWNTRDPVRLILENSTARFDNNATGVDKHTFRPGDILVGTRSNATASIESVDDVAFSKMKANIYRNNFTLTRTILEASRFTSTIGNQWNETDIPLSFSDEYYLDREETAIMSRSNEILNNGGNNTLDLSVRLINTGQVDTSPVIDHDISTVDIYESIINNDIEGEDTNTVGNAKVRYVSRTIELQEQLDAEDMNVWLTGYKPKGSDIHVYCKFKASEDIDAFSDIPWTKLERLGRTDFSSSTANRDDWKEFEYFVSEGTAEKGGAAVLENKKFKYISSTGTIFTDFKFFAIKIVLTTTKQNLIPRVKDYRAIALT